MTEEHLKEVKEIMLRNPEMYKNKLGNRKIEDLTLDDFDFQGFLIKNTTLRDALVGIGFKINERFNQLYIDNSTPFLDNVPLILQDDGMGYGANNGKLTDCYVDKDNTVNFWF